MANGWDMTSEQTSSKNEVLETTADLEKPFQVHQHATFGAKTYQL